MLKFLIIEINWPKFYKNGKAKTFKMDNMKLGMQEPMNFGIAVSVLVDKLNTMENADEVALFLESQGIKGNRGMAVSCPISNWIMRESGVDDVTTLYDVMVWDSTNGFSVCLERHGLGYGPWEFVKNFDGGKYPHLMRDEVY